MIRNVNAIVQLVKQAIRLHEDSLLVLSYLQKEYRAWGSFRSLVEKIFDVFKDLFSQMPLWIDITHFSMAQAPSEIPEELSSHLLDQTTLSHMVSKKTNSISHFQNTYNILYNSLLQGGKGGSVLEKEGRLDNYPLLVSKLYNKSEKMLYPVKNIVATLTSAPPLIIPDAAGDTPDSHREYQAVISDNRYREAPQGILESPVRHFQTWTHMVTKCQQEILDWEKYPDTSSEPSHLPAKIFQKPGFISPTLKESVNYAIQIQYSLLRYINTSETYGRISESPLTSMRSDPPQVGEIVLDHIQGSPLTSPRAGIDSMGKVVPDSVSGSPLTSPRAGIASMGKVVPDSISGSIVTEHREMARISNINTGRLYNMRSGFRRYLAIYQDIGKSLSSSFYESAMLSGKKNPVGGGSIEISPIDILINKGMIYEHLIAATMREFPLQPLHQEDESGMIRPLAPAAFPLVEEYPRQKAPTERMPPSDEEKRSQKNLQRAGSTGRTGFVEIPTIFPSRRDLPRVTPPDPSRYTTKQKIEHTEKASPAALQEVPQFTVVDLGHSGDYRGPGLNPIMNLVSSLATFQNQIVQQGHPELHRWLASPLVQSLHTSVHEQVGPFEDILGSVNTPLITSGGEMFLPGTFQHNETVSGTQRAASLSAPIPLLLNFGRDQVTRLPAMPFTSPPPLRTPEIAVRDTATSQQARMNTIHIQNTFNIAVKGSDSSSEGELRELGRKIGIILADEMKRYGGAP